MPYDRKKDLPEQVRDHLPEHGQDIYRKAFNSAWDDYADSDERRGDDSREEVAHRVAWAAVKQVYQKDEHGNWKRKPD